MVVRPLTLLGAFILGVMQQAGYTCLLVLQSLPSLWEVIPRPRHTRPFHVLFTQMYAAGVQSMGVTLIVGFFTGMILSISGGIEMSRYGQQEYVGALVMVTMCREMGPFMCGFTLAACVGAAMAAELGTMKVSEEIDALEVMSISPVRFLVMPRLLALTLMCPVLTILTSTVGIIGGGVIAYARLDVSLDIYYQIGFDFLTLKAVYTGVFKSLVFGLVIAAIACAQGLSATRGALGVGRATRQSVMLSFLMVIILGYYMTALFYGKL